MCAEADEVGTISVDVGPVTVTGHTVTVSVDPALLGDPTTLGFRVLVTRGTERKFLESSPGASGDTAPWLTDLWSWRAS